MVKGMQFGAGALARVGLAGVAALGLAGAALAQDALVACPSQQGLQAYIEAGRLPAECRQITVEKAGGGVCRFELGEVGDDGLMSALAGAAVPTRWWALCGSLERAAE